VTALRPATPDQLDNPGDLLARNEARFTSELHAFIEVEDGRITAR
jgi:hypothetical protein